MNDTPETLPTPSEQPAIQQSEPAQTEPKPAESVQRQDTIQLKVDGKLVELTLEELKQRASEALGAQKKFEEAARLRKEAEAMLRAKEASERVRESIAAGILPDEDDLRTMLASFGIDNPNIGEIMDTIQNEMASAQQPAQSGTAPRPLSLNDLPPEVQKAVQTVEQRELEQLRQNILESTHKGVDSDEIIRNILSQVPDSEKETVRQTLYDIAEDKVKTAILAEGRVFGPQLVQDVLGRLRTIAKTLVSPTRMAAYPPVQGIGPTVGGGQIRVDKPIERVPSTHPDYIDNRVQAALQRMAMQRRTGR